MMEVSKEIIRNYCDQGEKTDQASKKICAVYGSNTVSNAMTK